MKIYMYTWFNIALLTLCNSVGISFFRGLDEVVCFGSNTNTALRNTAHTTKQLIARELALERMRRAARNMNADSNSQDLQSNHSARPKVSSKLTPNTVLSLPLNSLSEKKSKVRSLCFLP